MAAQPFAARPFTSGFGRSGISGAGVGAGATTTPAAAATTAHQQNQNQRAERERRERERREAEERNAQALDALSEEQRDEVNEAFALFDLDKDSHIDYHELKVALKALGFDLPKSEILAILQTHGIPASSIGGGAAAGRTAAAGAGEKPTFSGPARLVLPHGAFVNVAAQRIAARDPRDEILRAFELFDADNKGSINLADLRRVARELGEGLHDDELVAMIEEFDLDGDGAISRDEFVGICLA